MKIKIGIPKSLLYYYYKDLWISFFQYLKIEVVESESSNKEILSLGEDIATDEACLSLKLFLGHVQKLKNQCDYVLVPRLYSVKKNEQVCTNFNCLYDLTSNSFSDINILNYNVDLTTHEGELLGFLKMGQELGFSYIKTYKAYKYAKEVELEKKLENEKEQKKEEEKEGLKVLVAGHPYNLYDEMIGMPIIRYLENENITVLYSNKIDHTLIDKECEKLSTDIHWTHSKEMMASIHYYQDKVDGIIILSSFPCGPDSLANELAIRKIKTIPILKLIFEDFNSDVGIITRLESYLDILKQKKEVKDEDN